MATKLDSMCNALAQLSSSEGTADRAISGPAREVQRHPRQQHDREPDRGDRGADPGRLRRRAHADAAVREHAVREHHGSPDGAARRRARASLAGLNIIVDGKMVPLAELAGHGRSSSSAAARAATPGGLLERQVGPVGARQLQLRREGRERSRARASMPTSGRSSPASTIASRTDAVLGGALSYGNSSVDSRPTKARSTPSRWALSLYGSVYAAKNFYFDAIVNVANSSYDADRNITYVDGYGTRHRRCGRRHRRTRR